MCSEEPVAFGDDKVSTANYLQRCACSRVDRDFILAGRQHTVIIVLKGRIDHIGTTHGLCSEKVPMCLGCRNPEMMKCCKKTKAAPKQEWRDAFPCRKITKVYRGTIV